MTRTLQQLEPYLQGYWPFKTDFKDHSQNSNDSIPIVIEWKPTNRGLKPNFNGNNSFIDCGNNSSLHMKTDDATVSFYVKHNKKTYISTEVYLYCGAGDVTLNKDGFFIYASTNSTTITIFFTDGTAARIGGNFNTPNRFDGKWHHYVVTFNRDGNINLYLDGVISVNTVDISAQQGNIINYTTFRVGALLTSFINDGMMDNIRYYNTLFSADEVLNLYNSTKHAHGMIPAERSYTHQLGIKPEDGLVLGFDGYTKNADRTFTDMSGESNHGTNVGTGRDVGYFGEVRSFDGVDDYISSGSIGNIKSIEMLVEPDTTTEYLLDLNATATIDINAGTIQANNFTTPTIYRDAVVQSSISADVLSHIIITTGTNINATAVYLGKIAANYLDGKVKQVKLYLSELSLINVKSKFNSIATLPLFRVDFTDYPDNEDISYTDNEPIPYSTMKVGSNGTFKVDDDQLVCSENTSTLTLRNNHEFDGSEYITIDIGGTKYSGTGTITQGTVTVSISQGSRFITVAMSDTDVLNSIDIQFRAEVS